MEDSAMPRSKYALYQIGGDVGDGVIGGSNNKSCWMLSMKMPWSTEIEPLET